MAKVKSLAGKKFHRLTVIQQNGFNKQGNAKWECLCDCGNIKAASGGNLQSGSVRSCGCIRREHRRDWGLKWGGKITHGRSSDYIFKLWAHVRDRCLNPRSPFYHRYGGRGIALYKPWHDAATFIHDVIAEIGERPAGYHSLDRIDNDGDYGPGNIRWSTWKDQANNRSNNRRLEFNGISMTLEEWSRICGITSGGIKKRLRSGCSVEEALFAPKRKNQFR